MYKTGFLACHRCSVTMRFTSSKYQGQHHPGLPCSTYHERSESETATDTKKAVLYIQGQTAVSTTKRPDEVNSHNEGNLTVPGDFHVNLLKMGRSQTRALRQEHAVHLHLSTGTVSNTF